MSTCGFRINILMDNIIKLIKPFVALGKCLVNDSQNEIVQQAYRKNNWFTPDNVHVSLRAIAEEFLDEEKLIAWLKDKPSLPSPNPQKIGVVMAGNIPAVGFHDLLCVLLSGHDLMAKLSSDDQVLMLYLIEKLKEIEPSFTKRIKIVERLNAADAFIATGSDNTARYFEYYFAKKPHIIRRNRTSVGILTGEESSEDLLALGNDVLQYFGLGCRNVAKLYVPQNYDFTAFYEAIEPLQAIYGNHHKYFNNYEYNKSVYLINREPHLDNGFLITRESEALVSPISVLFFEQYDHKNALPRLLEAHHAKIQCVVSQNGWFDNSLSFGQTQCPTLSDYADGVDTMRFLANL